jgi:hypothetical protein
MNLVQLWTNEVIPKLVHLGANERHRQLQRFGRTLTRNWDPNKSQCALSLANRYGGSETIGSAKRAATIIRTQTPYDFIGCFVPTLTACCNENL